jgi:hypothetical protein
MARTWYATGLSVNPPSFEIGNTSVEQFVFDAEQAVTACTAVLTEIGSGTVITLGVSVVLATPLATVTINAPTAGLTRGKTYELEITWTNAAGRKWPRTLVLVVVA